MGACETAVLGQKPQESDVISFEAVDVTETFRVAAEDVQRTLPAGVVARSLALHMGMPDNVPWGLRAENSAFLNDAQPIGEQITPGSSVTLTPRAHLG